MFKQKILGLGICIFAAFMLAGCGESNSVRNMSSFPCSRFGCNFSDLNQNTGVVYIPLSNGAIITAVDDVPILQGKMMNMVHNRGDGTWADTAYVNPGVRVIEVKAWWDNTVYRSAIRMRVESGHAYRILFDKPSISFGYQDMGRNMAPADMVRVNK